MIVNLFGRFIWWFRGDSTHQPGRSRLHARHIRNSAGHYNISRPVPGEGFKIGPNWKMNPVTSRVSYDSCCYNVCHWHLGSSNDGSRTRATAISAASDVGTNDCTWSSDKCSVDSEESEMSLQPGPDGFLHISMGGRSYLSGFLQRQNRFLRSSLGVFRCDETSHETRVLDWLKTCQSCHSEKTPTVHQWFDILDTARDDHDFGRIEHARRPHTPGVSYGSESTTPPRTISN
jgi:hypothetical protein